MYVYGDKPSVELPPVASYADAFPVSDEVFGTFRAWAVRPGRIPPPSVDARVVLIKFLGSQEVAAEADKRLGVEPRLPAEVRDQKIQKNLGELLSLVDDLLFDPDTQEAYEETLEWYGAALVIGAVSQHIKRQNKRFSLNKVKRISNDELPDLETTWLEMNVIHRDFPRLLPQTAQKLAPSVSRGPLLVAQGAYRAALDLKHYFHAEPGS